MFTCNIRLDNQPSYAALAASGPESNLDPTPEQSAQLQAYEGPSDAHSWPLHIFPRGANATQQQAIERRYRITEWITEPLFCKRKAAVKRCVKSAIAGVLRHYTALSDPQL